MQDSITPYDLVDHSDENPYPDDFMPEPQKPGAIAIAIASAFDHNSGVAGRADPTAWDMFTIKIGKIEIEIMSSWATTARLTRHGKELLFVSEEINRRLYPLIDRLHDLLWRVTEWQKFADACDDPIGLRYWE